MLTLTYQGSCAYITPTEPSLCDPSFLTSIVCVLNISQDPYAIIVRSSPDKDLDSQYNHISIIQCIGWQQEKQFCRQYPTPLKTKKL